MFRRQYAGNMHMKDGRNRMKPYTIGIYSYNILLNIVGPCLHAKKLVFCMFLLAT